MAINLKNSDLLATTKYTYLSGIPTLALSKSGYRSKVTPSSQPVTQAPVCLLFIDYTSKDFNFQVLFIESKTFIKDFRKATSCSLVRFDGPLVLPPAIRIFFEMCL